MSNDNSQEPKQPRPRLWVEGVGQIFHLRAFPTSHSNTTVYFRTKIPAIAAYVLSDSAKLRPLCKAAYPVLYPPIENWSNDDETALAIRMIRAGGIVFDLSQMRYAGGSFDTDLAEYASQYHEMEKKRKYMFGWPPGSAGVWVLQLPEWETYDNFERLPLNFDGATPNKLWRNYVGGLEITPLEECDKMEDLCEKMKELGAIFYANAKKSKEVMDCGLFDEQETLRPKYGWAVSKLHEQERASWERKESGSHTGISCNPL